MCLLSLYYAMNNIKEDSTVKIPEPNVPVEVVKIPSQEKVKDWVADEVPVAIAYNGISHAVLMCTPLNLEEFALGFSVTEGIVPDISEIFDVTVEEGSCGGLVVDLEISQQYFLALKGRRRSMAGRTGCGICGTESLEMLEKPLLAIKPLANTTQFNMKSYHFGFQKLKEIQVNGQITGATHSVAILDHNGNFLGGAEDIGRHVAMDKAIGMMLKKQWKNPVFFISSRASYEMIQKAAVCGVEIVFAVSAPTNRAVNLAKKVGLTLVAFCRGHSANVYCNPQRLINIDAMKPVENP
ncbi:MAG: formate dehydrogenase accessory sulfurtransferase FdhD [Burkholderiales bacterium]|nr:formate dehydrogenase accessory sulfurtransferase FdhD [Burkholderiales bacterium]